MVSRNDWITHCTCNYLWRRRGDIVIAAQFSELRCQESYPQVDFNQQKCWSGRSGVPCVRQRVRTYVDLVNVAII